MNVRISKEFTLNAAIHYEGKLVINTYLIELQMEVTTKDMREQNIALDRIKYLFDMCLDSCVFVEQQDMAAIDNYLRAGIKICTLPDSPYDQVVGGVLISKLNAITERKLIIDEIKIMSRICDDVCFFISIEDEIPFNATTGAWWRENNTTISDCHKRPNKKDKIVPLKKENPDWADIGLTWKPKIKSKNSKVVYIDHETS